MEDKKGFDYSKVTEEDIERAEKARQENEYDVMDLLKAIVEKDEEEGEE